MASVRPVETPTREAAASLPGTPAAPAPGVGPVPGFLVPLLAISAAGIASYLAVIAVSGGLPALLEASDPLVRQQVKGASVISLLIGFTLASLRREPAMLRRDLSALAPLLPTDFQPPEMATSAPFQARSRHVVVAIGIALGLLMIPASFEGAVFPVGGLGSRHLFWSMTANALLFAGMARLAWLQQAQERFVDAALTPRLRFSLLDAESLSSYARRGLRGCLYWLLGSSMASLLFANWGFSWPVAIVVTCTLGLGAFVLLEPARRLHVHLAAAKDAELARTRAAIEAVRAAGLDADAADATARLPGLLAWESRIAAVHEWPFDLSTWLRFGVLAAVAIGSWLGGAVVERILGLALD